MEEGRGGRKGRRKSASASFRLFFFYLGVWFVRIEVFCCIPLVHDMRHSGSDGEKETNIAVRFRDGGAV